MLSPYKIDAVALCNRVDDDEMERLRGEMFMHDIETTAFFTVGSPVGHLPHSAVNAVASSFGLGGKVVSSGKIVSDGNKYRLVSA